MCDDCVVCCSVRQCCWCVSSEGVRDSVDVVLCVVVVRESCIL